jgi:glycosyltransferase involved in cell wall biosynthesis
MISLDKTEAAAQRTMSHMNRYTTLVVVPAFNASEYLPELIRRLKRFVCEEHLLIVNDGSTDDTLEILKANNVKYLSFQCNRGKGAALRAGFDYAVRHGYRSVLTLDADLQHLPEEIPRFYALDDGQRVIIGTRRIKLDMMPPGRWLSNNLTSIIISVFSGQRVRDSQSGFRLIPTSLLQAMPLRMTDYDLESELLFKAGALGCRIVEVPISTVYEGSHSHINPLTDTLRFIRQMFKRVWF